MSVRVLLVDDQALIRAGFRMILEAEDDLEVVGECGDGTQAIDSVKRFSPDVVLMDIRMPEMDGIEATRRIVGGDGETAVKVLMLTTFDLDEYVYDALRAGASGFLLKDASAGLLRHAVHAAARGEAMLSPQIASMLIAPIASQGRQAEPPIGYGALTRRERDVFGCWPADGPTARSAASFM